MINSQDIRAKSFEKAVFGGYDMASVDEFLESIARTMDDNAKEISTLKSKMKILANKVEEYRSTEEAMRLALVSAQQLAAQIEAEAREKADNIITEATAQSLDVLADLKKQVASEETRLAAAKASYSKFVFDARTMCERQIRYLEELPEDYYGEAAPKTAPAAVEIAEEPVEDLIEQIIEEPAQASDDFEATLMFSLD